MPSSPFPPILGSRHVQTPMNVRKITYSRECIKTQSQGSLDAEIKPKLIRAHQQLFSGHRGKI